MRPRPLLIVATLLASAPCLAGAQDLETVRRRGALRMLAFPHQETAFVRVNLDRGAMPREASSEHFQGFDVELLERFADSLGVELQVVPVSEPNYGALIPELLAGRADLIASSFSITEQRAGQVEFSRPYHTVHPVVVTRHTATLRSEQELSDLVGVVVTGSSQEQMLRKLGIAGEMVRRVDFAVECYGSVRDGQADYTLADSAGAAYALQHERDLRVAFQLPGESHYGIAVRPDSDLLGALNHFLLQMDASGELSALKARHSLEID